MLAPRNWHCFALYGSGGVTLLVTPAELNTVTLNDQDPRLRGPAIVVSRILGDTSGRFQAADIAARIFPVARPFVHDVLAADIVPNLRFDFLPYRADQLRRRSATEVEFLTPSNQVGLGTWSGLGPDVQPIAGVAIWRPDNDPRLVMLAVRLSSDLRSLSRTIIRQTEASEGDPKIR